MHVARTVELRGFPPGYFLLRSVANRRLLDVAQSKSTDGTPMILWPETETSLVQSLRSPEADNQIFFIDNTTGHLCSKVTGHAVDVEDDRLVLRHRHPMTIPYPNTFSHPIAHFSFDPKIGQVSVLFNCDPVHHASDVATPAFSARQTHTSDRFILTSVPQRRPAGLMDNLSSFFSSATALATGRQVEATPEDVFDGQIDLREDEIVEGDRGEAGEVDDDPVGLRQVRVVRVREGARENANAMLRRRWEVLPLRAHRAMTGAM